MPSGRAHYQVTLADALEAHAEVLAISGGREGILSLDNLQSALGRPYSGYFRMIDRKSAALVEAIIRNHPFADGNKRTAFQLMMLLLRRSHYDVEGLATDAVSRELEELIVGIASRATDAEEFRIWLKDHLVKID